MRAAHAPQGWLRSSRCLRCGGCWCIARLASRAASLTLATSPAWLRARSTALELKPGRTSPAREASPYWTASARVDEVVHQHDVAQAVIVRSWRQIAGRDPHARNPCIGEQDADEREAAGPGRRRHGAAVEQVAGVVVVLDESAGAAITATATRTAAVRLIDVSEHRAKRLCRRRNAAVGAGQEERGIGDVRPDGVEEPQLAERLECGLVRRDCRTSSPCPPAAPERSRCLAW